MVGKSRERCRPRTAKGPETALGTLSARPRKAKEPGAALSTWSASCQGESLKDTWDILTVWTANPGPCKAPGMAWPYVFSLLMACLYAWCMFYICYLFVGFLAGLRLTDALWCR